MSCLSLRAKSHVCEVSRDKFLIWRLDETFSAFELNNRLSTFDHLRSSSSPPFLPSFLLPSSPLSPPPACPPHSIGKGKWRNLNSIQILVSIYLLIIFWNVMFSSTRTPILIPIVYYTCVYFIAQKVWGKCFLEKVLLTRIGTCIHQTSWCLYIHGWIHDNLTKNIVLGKSIFSVQYIHFQRII